MTNIAAVVVLYNPDESFVDNIKSYLNQVSMLVIVDNSEKPDLSVFDSLKENDKIKYIINHQNYGVAKALNEGIKLAAAAGYRWVLTMDQDSWFEKEMIENYLYTLNELINKEEIAVIGPVFEKRPVISITEKTKQVTSLITSGSLVNAAVFNSIGGYNEKLFIDEVDHEYCYRVKLKGFDIIQVLNIYLNHSLGKEERVKTILARKNKLKSLHSALRLYYMVRNSCYVISIYKNDFPEEMKIKRKDVLVRIKNNLLYGPNKIKVLKYVVRGYFDFKRDKLGKFLG